jgi:hypothetical protein
VLGFGSFTHDRRAGFLRHSLSGGVKLSVRCWMQACQDEGFRRIVADIDACEILPDKVKGTPGFSVGCVPRQMDMAIRAVLMLCSCCGCAGWTLHIVTCCYQDLGPLHRASKMFLSRIGISVTSGVPTLLRLGSRSSYHLCLLVPFGVLSAGVRAVVRVCRSLCAF